MRSVLFFDAGNVFNTNCPKVSVYCLDIDEGELDTVLESLLLG